MRALLPGLTACVYQPIWTYDLEMLWDDLSAHLAFGLSLAIGFRARP